MLYDKIIESLLDVKRAVKEKFGDDGTKERGGRDYSSGPCGFDRMRYEIGRIAEAVRHSTAGADAKKAAALIPAELPQADGRYVLVMSGGVPSWEAAGE
jgi:hypothetical protein